MREFRNYLLISLYKTKKKTIICRKRKGGSKLLEYKN